MNVKFEIIFIDKRFLYSGDQALLISKNWWLVLLNLLNTGRKSLKLLFGNYFFC